MFGMQQVECGEGRFGMKFQSLKARHAGGSSVSEIVEVDLKRMKILDNTIEPETVGDNFEDGDNISSDKFDDVRAKLQTKRSKSESRNNKGRYGN